MKKLLIITYYWPPSGGSGVQRWLKFSKYLPNFGFKPIIYTPENPYFQLKDKGLQIDFSEQIEVWKNPIWEPYALKDRIFGKGKSPQGAGIISDKKNFRNKIFNWIRGNFFIPDPKIFWVKPSVRYLYKRIKNEDISYIVTTGPPHSMHLIGLRLKRMMPNIKWIADFRDPWSNLDILSEFNLTGSTIRKHKKQELEVLTSADVVLTVSETWVRDLEALGANRVELITNGFDVEDFQLEKKKNNKFVIGHYGVLNHLRHPRYLWKILNRICKDNEDFNKRLEIRLSGNIDKEVISEINSYAFLRDKLKQLGYLSHKKVLEQYNETDVLLLLIFNSKSGLGNYPGKIFEYFAAKKPILAFGPKNSDAEVLIKKTGTGIYHSYEEEDLLESVNALYRNDFSFSIKDTDNFNRMSLTEKLSSLINSL